MAGERRLGSEGLDFVFQDFDWEAAAAEIDDVCLKSQRVVAPASASDIDYATASTWIYPGAIRGSVVSVFIYGYV